MSGATSGLSNQLLISGSDKAVIQRDNTCPVASLCDIHRREPLQSVECSREQKWQKVLAQEISIQCPLQSARMVMR